ncbi:hypothetical protein BLNAU_162 [Blattamonas nauphoetae]|uniref:Uncharacterized protein n=1 Tax=Blattamonas nauphoetae TaxID=2049346 RepID=A0ABQ9YM93_9EUKA|nr:hypothetical protein BLNAU_162 [Blattamonas nauphoetae]
MSLPTGRGNLLNSLIDLENAFFVHIRRNADKCGEFSVQCDKTMHRLDGTRSTFSHTNKADDNDDDSIHDICLRTAIQVTFAVPHGLSTSKNSEQNEIIPEIAAGSITTVERLQVEDLCAMLISD